jgi:glycosyltransferase involved in cell wall biosynthesis
MTKHLFSIITCTYNSSKYLAQNLNSVANQTHNDYEQIFVDGYSSDGTSDILHNYQSAHPNTKIVQAPAKGIANAMNVGIGQANGQYLLFLNSDDYFFSDSVLEKVAEHIEKHHYSWYYGIINTISADGQKLFVYPRYFYQRWFRYWTFSLSFIMQHQAIFYNRGLFEKYGLYDESVNSMDYEYAIRIRRKERAGFIKVIVANFRLGGFSSVHKDAMERDIEQVLKKHFIFGDLWLSLRELHIKLFVNKKHKH